jgi:hypothetical protein
MKYILMMSGTKADFDGYAHWPEKVLQANMAFMRSLVDTPRHKCGRFSVLRRDLRHGSPKALPEPLYIPCRVVVPMQARAALRAGVPADG